MSLIVKLEKRDGTSKGYIELQDHHCQEGYGLTDYEQCATKFDNVRAAARAVALLVSDFTTTVPVYIKKED